MQLSGKEGDASCPNPLGNMLNPSATPRQGPWGKEALPVTHLGMLDQRTKPLGCCSPSRKASWVSLPAPRPGTEVQASVAVLQKQVLCSLPTSETTSCWAGWELGGRVWNPSGWGGSHIHSSWFLDEYFSSTKPILLPHQEQRAQLRAAWRLVLGQAHQLSRLFQSAYAPKDLVSDSPPGVNMSEVLFCSEQDNFGHAQKCSSRHRGKFTAKMEKGNTVFRYLQAFAAATQAWDCFR